MILQAATHLLSVRIAGVQRSSSHWPNLAAALQTMRLESFGITYKTLDYEAVQLGLQWEQVGSWPNKDFAAIAISDGGENEIKNKALEAALAAGLKQKVEFSRETFAKHKVEKLSYQSRINVGGKIFKPASVSFIKGDRVQDAKDPSKHGVLAEVQHDYGETSTRCAVKWDNVNEISNKLFPGDIIRVEKEEEKNLGSKQSVAASAAVAKVLAGMRTLRAALRPPWADSGLRSSRTISDVDLSFNTFDPSAVKALPAWVLKSIVKELVLEGIVLASSDTHSDRESREKHRTGISGLYDLVKSLGAPQSRLQVFVMTLAHPPQCKQGAGARAAVAGAVSNKKLKRLTTTCSTAGSSTRTGHFFCVGLYDLYDADASGSGLNANRRGTRCAAICSRDVLAAAFPGGAQHSPRFA